MSLPTYEIYNIARLALDALIWLPSLVLFFLVLFMVRRRKDPARTGFLWLKFSFLFFVGYVFWELVAYTVGVVYYQLSNNSYSGLDSNAEEILLMLEAQTFAVSSLCYNLALIAIFLTLITLGSGIGLATDGQWKSIYKIIKPATLVISGILVVLSIVTFGLRVKLNVVQYGDQGNIYGYYYSPSLTSMLKAARRIGFATTVLLFILGLLVVARTIMVVLETRHDQRFATASRFTLASACLFLLATLYNLIIYARFVNLGDPDQSGPNAPYYLIVLEVPFSIWPLFILLVILFALGCKKANGLWSTEQPFMMVNPSGPGMPLPPQQQQQQQQQMPWGSGYDSHQQYAPQPQQQYQSPAGYQPQMQQQQQQQYPQQQQFRQQQPGQASHMNQQTPLSPNGSEPSTTTSGWRSSHLSQGTHQHQQHTGSTYYSPNQTQFQQQPIHEAYDPGSVPERHEISGSGQTIEGYPPQAEAPSHAVR